YASVVSVDESIDNRHDHSILQSHDGGVLSLHGSKNMVERKRPQMRNYVPQSTNDNV
ncbi:hypothetical protein S245_032499, partial [Arachis hypogaea]